MVYHIGVILGANQKLLKERGVAHAGSFVVSLANTNPGIWSGVVPDDVHKGSKYVINNRNTLCIF